MHAGLLAFALAGSVFGWVFKRYHYALQDWRAAVARHRGARAVLRREIMWSAGAAVAALIIARALL